MLNEKVRNIIVGLTMILALVGLMIGVLVLGNSPFSHGLKPYAITILTPNAMGLSSGNHVNFNGVNIGNISTVELQPDYHTVKLTLSIESGINIPTNAFATVGKETIGGAYVSIAIPPGTAPTTFLAKDGTASITAQLADTGIIPQSAINDLNKLTDSITALLEQKSLEEFDKQDPKKRVANISILVQRLERDAHGIDQIVGDPKVREQFKQLIDNLNATSSNLRETSTKLDDTLNRANASIDKIGAAATQASTTLETTRGEIIKTSQQAASLLASLQKSTDAIANGKGTAGKLVNDPRLYDSLVDLSKNLKTTTDDLRTLIQKWSEEGVPLKLK